jgi:FtsP/CotA-like multicopper oxidase with cupredoxin domain
MNYPLTRRTLLKSAAALCASGLVLPPVAFARERRLLVAGTRTIEVLGRAATVFGITGADGAHGLHLDHGERFEVTLENRAAEATSIHWHGQVPTPEADGITETGYVGPVGAGESRAYDFVARPGTHWMHSHHGLQEQALMAAPLIVRDAEAVRADIQEVVVLLHDFSFRSPEEILEGLTGSSTMDHGASQVAPAPMDHSTMAMGEMDLNDIEFDAYLANDRTLDDPLVVRTERSGRVRLRIINGAASTAFWLDLGEYQASVIAVDGNPVEPIAGSRFPLAQAQRIDLLVEVPAGAVVPVFAQREGDRARTGVILAAPGAEVPKFASTADAAAGAIDMSLETTLRSTSPLASRAADVRHSVMLTGSMSPYLWTLDDQPWATRRKLEVSAGQRVELKFMNHSMMAHPMHLHGHHFQVVDINGETLSGALRDTVLVPAMGSVTVAFEADNPGRWLYHCHNLYHMAAGMMSELVYV